MEFFVHFLVLVSTALAAVRQCLIVNCLAIHIHVIVVSYRNRAAIRAFLLSRFLHWRNSDLV
jgi:hypothetical protein